MTKTINVFSVIWVNLHAGGVPSVAMFTTEEAALHSFRLALADLQDAHPTAVAGFALSSRPGAVQRSAGLYVAAPGNPCDLRPVANVTLRRHEVETYEAPQGWGEVEAGSPIRGTVGEPEDLSQDEINRATRVMLGNSKREA